MTVGHLLSRSAAPVTSCWAFFEERDLIASYGQIYRDYARRVPMLMPFSNGNLARAGRRPPSDELSAAIRSEGLGFVANDKSRSFAFAQMTAPKLTNSRMTELD
jgi:hypothetical protein